jgi:deoxycytidylate deaminase
MIEVAPRESEELVIGLVGPVGSNLEAAQDELEVVLAAANYESKAYRLSSIFGSLADILPPLDESNEYRRLKTAMDAGDELRRLTGRPEIMAVQAAYLIVEGRPEDDAHRRQAGHRRAHVLRSLKRREEVEYLRRLYGPRFVLVSVYLPREQRFAELRRKGMSKIEATELIERDEQGLGDHGQATSETFELADLFLDGEAPDLRTQLSRFLDLILGCPFHTPSMAEHAMFCAYAASLRSGDLSRQVGAVLVTNDGMIVAEGCNDAPRFGGGPQWPDSADSRDLRKGYDSNERIKRQIVERLLEGLSGSAHEQVRDQVRASGLLDITEYGRAVHAEMSALLACARRGVPTRDQTLFCTTFPCHNCAKHIVAAGVARVVFIEPYPKSRALQLHDDSLSEQKIAGKVQLQPFVGVGPRRYVELFALRDPYGARIRRKGSSGGRAVWNSHTATPSVHDRLVTYVELEQRASIELIEALELVRQQRHQRM